jgi:sec-independent protein translocase protein TatA
MTFLGGDPIRHVCGTPSTYENIPHVMSCKSHNVIQPTIKPNKPSVDVSTTHIMKSNVVTHAVMGIILSGVSMAFLPSPSISKMKRMENSLGRFRRNTHIMHVPIAPSYRTMMGQTRLMGLFGLGAGEVVIILISILFLLGPQKIAELGRDAGKLTGELKEVPKEFQRGLVEGEIDARAKKAKPMDTLEE